MSDFFASGGQVLGIILVTTFVMWFLIVERYWYFFFQKGDAVNKILIRWAAMSDADTWRLRMIRACYISQFKQQVTMRIGWIKVLITVSMLLGLLGTIVGMIDVFEGMMLTQASDVRVLAAGVSRTVIPAMAGLVAALSGLYFSFQLEQSASREVQKLADKLTV